MYIVTMDHYAEERTTQHQKSQTRSKPKAVPKGQGQSNKWQVSYVQAVKGTDSKQ